jgi:cytochrome c biogenesis protein CcmG, thiol:disulfide interchange protein DsbE
MKSIYLKFIPLIAFVFLVVFFWKGLSLDPRDVPSVQISKPVPEFTLPLLSNPTATFSPHDMKNKVVLLNVWASWCAACTEEQVFLMQLAQDGVPIYGLNYKDSPNDAKKWLATWGNPYLKTGSDIDGRAAIDLGVYGAPETFLIDASGIIRLRHTGPLSEQIWIDKFVPVIKKIKETKHA